MKLFHLFDEGLSGLGLRHAPFRRESTAPDAADRESRRIKRSGSCSRRLGRL